VKFDPVALLHHRSIGNGVSSSNWNIESREGEPGGARVRRSVAPPHQDQVLLSQAGTNLDPSSWMRVCCGVAFVSDQNLFLDAIEDAQRILAEHVEPTSRRNPNHRLLLFLDSRDVVAALRPRAPAAGCGVVK
jgi:hypothetical protein